MSTERKLIIDLVNSTSYRELQEIGKNRPFSLFDQLEEIFDENCSSRFLRYFLTSKESHGLGLELVRAILRSCYSALPEILQSAIPKTTATTAIVQWRTPDGRLLDIMVDGYDRQGRRTFALGIENKLGSGESKNQLAAEAAFDSPSTWQKRSGSSTAEFSSSSSFAATTL